MILTVSTVKDKLSNVQRFVRGNLAGGVDHMILFLDVPSPEVEAWLDTQPAVTYVVTDKSWWNGTRPQLLNKRQRVNANLARSVLTLADWADWIFHIDADEIAQIDRTALAKVPSGKNCVGLQPLEVVSKMTWEREPTLFKRLLSEPELHLLQALDVIAEPTNSLYFRSHIAGKVGIRPRLDLWLGIHKAVDRDDNRQRLVRDPGLRLLHFESYSGDDFVRKWTAMVGSGPSIHFGPARMKIATAIKALLEMDLPTETTSRYLAEIYQQHMADRVDVLADLGLLEEIDPLAGSHVPAQLAERDRATLAGWLEALRAVDKRKFLPEIASPSEVEGILAAISGRSGAPGRRGLFRRS